jgi:DDE superfamily endonuclease
MTAFNFERWLLRMEEHFQNQGRKVLMFINTYPVHPKRLQKQLNHIQLEFIPPNITSTVQPMRVHIFRALKLFYRNIMIKERLQSLTDNTVPYEKPTILDAIRLVAKVWECNMTPKLITHFFEKSGFTSCYSNVFIDDCCEDRKNLLLIVETEIAANFEKLQKFDESAARDTWQHFVDVDKSASICAILTDDDILALVGKTKSDRDQDSDDDRPSTSAKKFKSLSVPEMKAAILKVHRSLEQAPGVPTDVFQSLNKIDHFLDNLMPK